MNKQNLPISTLNSKEDKGGKHCAPYTTKSQFQNYTGKDDVNLTTSL